MIKMTMYAFKCIKDNPSDEKILWRVGQWEGRNLSGGIYDYTKAQFYTNLGEALQTKATFDLFKRFGFEFEMVEFDLTEIIKGK